MQAFCRADSASCQAEMINDLEYDRGMWTITTNQADAVKTIIRYCKLLLFWYNVLVQCSPLRIRPNMPFRQAFFIGATDDIKTINGHE